MTYSHESITIAICMQANIASAQDIQIAFEVATIRVTNKILPQHHHNMYLLHIA
jgi:hypothetical protein